MKYNRCKWGLTGLWLLGVAAAADDLPPVTLHEARNLLAEARDAESRCAPLLLEFSAIGCEYCTLLEEEVLKPMLRNRDYDELVVMRKVMVDSATPVTGFNGEQLNISALTYRYRIFVTPTLIFLDSRGEELAERMVGVNTLEMYGGYLDRALEHASAELRRNGRCD